MNESWEKVKAFHETFGHPISHKPRMLDQARTVLRHSWMLEELNEFIDSKDMYEQADAMIDLVYFALGTLVEMGIKPDDIFAVVHKANMTKLWSDGMPHYSKEGKTIKPPAWVDPRREIVEVINASEKAVKAIIE